MKRFFCWLLCFLLVFSLIGCTDSNDVSSSDISLQSGNYFAVGDYEKFSTPYVSFNTENHQFEFCGGVLFSFAYRGSYKIEGEKIIATSQSTIFQFEIIDKNTVVLVDYGDEEDFYAPLNTKFVFSEEMK